MAPLTSTSGISGVEPPSNRDRLWVYGGLGALVAITGVGAWLLARPSPAAVPRPAPPPIVATPAPAAPPAPVTPAPAVLPASAAPVTTTVASPAPAAPATEPQPVVATPDAPPPAIPAQVAPTSPHPKATHPRRHRSHVSENKGASGIPSDTKADPFE